jgi:1,4-alpha-glucan branching enzyme
LAQGREWRIDGELDWELLEIEPHQGMKCLSRDLNHIYRDLPALHELDFTSDGFAWIDCHDADQSVLSYLRRGRDDSSVAVLLNFTPVPRLGYRIGVPKSGLYREIFNSDSLYYGGSNLGNGIGVATEDMPWMGYPHSIVVTIPPLAGIILALAE